MASFWLIVASLAFAVILIRKVFRSAIYDFFITSMTTKWYSAVVERLAEKSSLLDVGIGTGTALLNNKTRLLQKDVTITGVDYDASYVMKCDDSFKEQGLEARGWKVQQASIYDFHPTDRYHAAYFSGSLMIMPDAARALRHVKSLLLAGGEIYVTQTLEREKSSITALGKSLLTAVTTIDFGQAVSEQEFLAAVKAAGLIVAHSEPLTAGHGMLSNESRGPRLFVLKPDPVAKPVHGVLKLSRPVTPAPAASSEPSPEHHVSFDANVEDRPHEHLSSPRPQLKRAATPFGAPEALLDEVLPREDEEDVCEEEPKVVITSSRTVSPVVSALSSGEPVPPLEMEAPALATVQEKEPEVEAPSTPKAQSPIASPSPQSLAHPVVAIASSATGTASPSLSAEEMRAKRMAAMQQVAANKAFRISPRPSPATTRRDPELDTSAVAKFEAQAAELGVEQGITAAELAAAASPKLVNLEEPVASPSSVASPAPAASASSALNSPSTGTAAAAESDALSRSLTPDVDILSRSSEPDYDVVTVEEPADAKKKRRSRRE